jgi:hypothetical protein
MPEHKYNNPLLQIQLRTWLHPNEISIWPSKETIFLSMIDNIHLFTLYVQFK